MSDSLSADLPQYREHCSPSGTRDHVTKRLLLFALQVEGFGPHDPLIDSDDTSEEAEPTTGAETTELRALRAELSNFKEEVKAELSIFKEEVKVELSALTAR